MIAARGAEKLSTAADELSKLPGGGEVLAVPADVRRQEDVDALVARTIERFGRLDMLVNNAGRSARGEAAATSPEEFAELMELNFVALVRMTRSAMPHLVASRGWLVNIGSLAGKTAARYMGATRPRSSPSAPTRSSCAWSWAIAGRACCWSRPDRSPATSRASYPAEKVAGLPPSARKPGGGVKVGLLKSDRLAEQILRACERGRSELVVPGRARLVFAINQLWPKLGDWIVRKMS